MATKAQIEANRRNSQLSTGPKTSDGKSSVSKNATKHGLFSKAVLIDGDDEELFHDLNERLWTELSPVGVIEENLVERITTYMWRLRRIVQIEAWLLEPRQTSFETDEKFRADWKTRLAYHFEPDRFSTLCRYEIAIERMMQQAFLTLNLKQNARRRRESLQNKANLNAEPSPQSPFSPVLKDHG